jgi:hypothetical protein
MAEITQERIQEFRGVNYKIWLLRCIIGVTNKPPFIIYNTRDYNLIIRADTESKAREIADKRQSELFGINHPWLSKLYTRLLATLSLCLCPLKNFTLQLDSV